MIPEHEWAFDGPLKWVRAYLYVQISGQKSGGGSSVIIWAEGKAFQYSYTLIFFGGTASYAQVEGVCPIPTCLFGSSLPSTSAESKSNIRGEDRVQQLQFAVSNSTGPGNAHARNLKWY